VTGDYYTRFSGIARLYSAQGLERLRRSHVCVIGVGGVGSWAVEALARSGIGEITMIDLDEVCTSNVNRQLPALSNNIGRAKIEVMEERIHGINPDAKIHSLLTFFTESKSRELLATRFDYVIDAIDGVRNKALLIALCRELRIPVITMGGAGGRRDPTQVQIVDLALSSHDRLLLATRTELRKHHGFPKGPNTLFGVDCVMSKEAQVFPAQDGAVCDQPLERGNLRLNCESGYGTATFVTGAFGFAAAGAVVKSIAVSPGAVLNQKVV
jgi:tRNA A37 threonylcarbamoyladenosine dehydratase